MVASINASTSAGVVTTADTSGILQLQTASTAAVTITAAQLVGIGTASPTVQLLNIAATSISGPTNNPAGVQLTDSGASLSSQIVNRSGNTLHNVSSTKAHSFQVNSTETVGLNTYGIGLGGTTPTSGMGITFPATQSASSDANTLDDYEEGTWSPTLKGDNAATGQTYSNQYGYYVKVGKLVYVTYDVTLTAKGTISGNITVSSLPFSCGGYNAGNAGGPVAYWQNMTTSWSSIACHLGQGNNFANSYGIAGSASTTTTGTVTTDLANNTRWMGMLVYSANA